MSKRSAVRGIGAAHDERRRDILEAVFAIVDTEGTDQVSIRGVADAAGVSVGRVQHYFPSKDDLLSEAAAAISERGTERVRLSIADASDDPAKVLTAVLAELVPDSDEELRLFRIAQAFETYALSRPRLKDRVTDGYDELVALVTLLLGRCHRGHADFLPEARELLALAIGLASLTVTGNLTAEQAHDITNARLAAILDSARAR